MEGGINHHVPLTGVMYVSSDTEPKKKGYISSCFNNCDLRAWISRLSSPSKQKAESRNPGEKGIVSSEMLRPLGETHLITLSDV